MLIAILSAKIQDQYDSYNNISGIIGTSISAGFLFIIASINSVSVFMIIRCMKELKSRTRDRSEELDWDQLHDSGGFFSRVFGKRLFRVIDRPYKMYFVGFLFGLGFDTATEIALLAIAALQSAGGASAWLVLCLPFLFTCGMTLVDTLDGMLMLGVYGWADVSPMRKLYYNLVITAVSCLFAIFVANIEALGVVQSVPAAGGRPVLYITDNNTNNNTDNNK